MVAGLERRGFDDVEVVSEWEVQVVRGGGLCYQSTRVRAADPLPAC